MNLHKASFFFFWFLVHENCSKLLGRNNERVYRQLLKATEYQDFLRLYLLTSKQQCCLTDNLGPR